MLPPIACRYRYAQRSDALWSEIKYVLDTLAEPLTNLFQATLQNIQVRPWRGPCGRGGVRCSPSPTPPRCPPPSPSQGTSDPAQLKMLLNAIELMCEIFYSLNYQVRFACALLAPCSRFELLPVASPSHTTPPFRTSPPFSKIT